MAASKYPAINLCLTLMVEKFIANPNSFISFKALLRANIADYRRSAD